MTTREIMDQRAMMYAERLHRRHHAIQNAGLAVGKFSEAPYCRGDFTTLASFTAEASLLGKTPPEQPQIPSSFLTDVGKAILFQAMGVVSTTGTPTYIFQCRLSSTVGTSTLSGTSIGVTPTITAASGVTNSFWWLDLLIWVKAPGQGTTNTTLNCQGLLRSPDGFGVNSYALSPTTPPTATFTATIDNSVTQYFNLSVTCGTSNASNAVTCKTLVMHGLN